jgi:hypothetical protein
MRLRQVEKAFDHPDYIFELKHDGFRAVGYLQNGMSRATVTISVKPQSYDVPSNCGGMRTSALAKTSCMLHRS